MKKLRQIDVIFLSVRLKEPVKLFEKLNKKLRETKERRRRRIWKIYKASLMEIHSKTLREMKRKTTTTHLEAFQGVNHYGDEFKKKKKIREIKRKMTTAHLEAF